jgi:RHS repeat-associated protein
MRRKPALRARGNLQRHASYRPLFEVLEERVLLDAADIATTAFTTDVYQQYLHTAFVAEGRIGGVATVPVSNYELDVGPSLASPASTRPFPWDQRASGFPFRVAYAPNGMGGGTLTFSNGDVPHEQLTYNVPASAWFSNDHHDTIFVRTVAEKAGSELRIGGSPNLSLTIPGGAVDLRAPDGTIPAFTDTPGPNGLYTLQISGVDLQQGFTLTGRTFWLFPTSGGNVPADSQLAFQVYVGTFQPPTPNPTPAACGCDCGCAPQGLPQEAPNSSGGNPAGNGSSSGGVRYFDGTTRLTTTDLSSTGFGTSWGQTRSWSNQPTFGTDRQIYPQAAQNGSGQVISQLPWLLKDGQTIDVIVNGADSLIFDSAGGGYQERFFLQDQLVHNPGEFVLTDTQGDHFYFYDFSGSTAANKRGQLKSVTDPNGNVTSITSNTADGQIQEIQRTDPASGVTESYLYSYYPPGPQQRLLSNVTLRRETNCGPFSTVRQTDYTYYDGAPNGNAGDLKTETLKDGAGNPLDTTYYRYYIPLETGGYTHALKYSYDDQSYARLVQAFPNPDNATDAQAAPFATTHYVYDSQHRVTTAVVQGSGCSACTGGQGTYTYSYTTSANSAGFNSWRYKTTETLPDGNLNYVYANSHGEVMLKVFHDQGSTQNWETFYQYDDQGRITRMANPSAVFGYDEARPDLLNQQGGHYQFLYDDRGLITRTEYYTTTTAGETTPGGVTGYEYQQSIQRGQMGTPILQSTTQYFSHTGGGATIYPTATDTVYRNTIGTGPETTSFSYTYYDDSTRIQVKAISQPLIVAAQNGPGTPDLTMSVYDTYGRTISTTDAGGFVTSSVYDAATGSVIQTTRDVGGLNLTTQMEVDNLGRTTTLTDPNGNITYTVYDDPAHEVRTYHGWQISTNLPTGPTEVMREDRPGSYTETLTMSAVPHVTAGRPDGTEAITGLQTLERSYDSNGGQVVRTDAYYDFTGIIYSTAPNLGTEGTNYNRTHYDYDERGRENRVQDPTGTITRTVYDGLNRVISTWTGTDDMPAVGFWSPTNPAGMFQFTANVYDDGGVGDGNRTQMTQFPDTVPADQRVTRFYYDWRDRLVAQKAGAQAIEDTTTHRPIMYTEYDNLNQSITHEQYDGDGITITTTNGVPDRPAANRLRARTTYEYDDQGRVFRTHTFSVDQTNGTVSPNSLTTDTFYDHRGEVIKKADPGGLVTKTQYDGAGRVVKAFVTDGMGDSTWADANTVANNNVLSQTQTQYDANSNVILTIGKERFHDETATGELGDPATAPHARVSYLASYYDAADRVLASVDVGTNGGAAYVRPTTVPPRSDTTLITSYTYNDAGWVQDVTDPRGILTRTTYDNLHRTTKTIEGYTGGTIANDRDRTTEYTYDGSGHLVTLKADLPAGPFPFQTTQYVYGVSNATGSAINSNDLLAATKYPDKTTGNPSDTEKEIYTYNALGQPTSMTDRNGTRHTYTYDVLGRQTSDMVITPGAGVDGSVRRMVTAYDTAGRPFLYTSYDATSGGNVMNQTEQIYNGLGQLITEYQSHAGEVNPSSTPAVQYSYSEMVGGVNHSRPLSMTYPNGRVLSYNYDDLTGLDDRISRLSSLSDVSGMLEAYSYLGLDTVVERAHPQNQVNLTYIQQEGVNPDGGDQYAGLDRFGRVIDQLWGAGTTDRFQYGYDRDGNRLFRDNLVNPAFGELYHTSGVNDVFDSQGILVSTSFIDRLNRLTDFSRGTLVTPSRDAILSPSHSKMWTLDVLGNWSAVTTDSVTQNRTHNQQNQITSIPGATTPTYDNNGNMTRDETGATFVYDAWNRLVRLNAGAGSVTYTYDALGRRVTENAGTLRDLYYSDNWQVIEERVGGVMQVQYVWSPVYVDALVERDTNGGPRLYVQQDANWNVTAVVDVSGNVLERYIYDPYGKATILAPLDWSSRGTSLFGWVYLHQGGRYDTASGLYNFRNRDYSPTLGRWLQQDPEGYVDSMNLYEYVSSNPPNRLDPSGLGEIIITLGKSTDKLRFTGPNGTPKSLTVEFLGDTNGFPSVSGGASSINKVEKKKDVENQGEYTLKYLAGVTLTLTPEKDDTNKFTIAQTGDARFINFCYHAPGKKAQCTRGPDAAAFLDGSFNLVNFKQDPNNANGAGIFNYTFPVNLSFVGGTFLKAPPFGKTVRGKVESTSSGYVTFTVYLGKGTDLCKLLGTGKSKEVPIEFGEVKITSAPEKK